jgi:hypothetical protein
MRAINSTTTTTGFDHLFYSIHVNAYLLRLSESFHLLRRTNRCLRQPLTPYAKFARIAINWLASKPDGENVISQELRKLSGADLLEFNRPQRVMIAAESDSDRWLESAV